MTYCRSEEWAAAIGRTDILNRASSKNLFVCSDHFADKMYNCPALRHTSSSLTHFAVPTISNREETHLQQEEVLQVTPYPLSNTDHTYFRSSTSQPKHTGILVHVHTQTNPPTRDATTQTKSLCISRASQTRTSRSNVSTLKARIVKLQNSLRRHKQIIKKDRQKKVGIKTLEELPSNMRDFICNQIRNCHHERRGMRYTSTFYKNCFLIYHHSRRCYGFLRRILCMPSPNTLRKQIQRIFAKVSACVC